MRNCVHTACRDWPSGKDELGADRLLQWQERDSARTARDAYDGGGTSARTPVSERDGTHSECPRETNPKNYFPLEIFYPQKLAYHYRGASNAVRPLVLHSARDHHAFHEDAKPGDWAGPLAPVIFSPAS